MTGRFLSERLGRVHFWLWIVGFTLTFVPQYQLGADGHAAARSRPTRPTPAGTTLNLVSTVGAFVLALGHGAVPRRGRRRAARARGPRPTTRGRRNSLEWATTSPPPHHNFDSLPPIRSERPVFDARVAARDAGGPRTEDAT